jgi:hypothetical protein
MDIHKPRPVHNWREFLTEIGTIVIGVLLALGAEQAVEAIHWRDQVVDARTAITAETAKNLQSGIVRMRVAACVESRLDSVARIVDAASISGKLPPVGNIRTPPLSLWPRGAWESMMASQTALHFPREELSDLTDLYNSVSRANDRNLQETEVWAQIDTIVGPGRRLDPASEAPLRNAVSLARSYNRGLALAGLRILQAVEKRTMAFSAQDSRDIVRAERQALPCVPLGAIVPPNYGQGPLDNVMPEYEAALKHLPAFKQAD